MFSVYDLYYPFNNELNENIINIFRSGEVKISVGKTTYEKLTQSFIMIDNMAWLFRLKPSFVMLFSSEKALDTPGSSTNVQILYPRYANKNLEFNVLSKGRAKLSTYFLGEPKEGRLFDIYYRFFETGFRLTNFEGLENSIFKLGKNTSVSISSKDYKHPTFIKGETSKFKVRARVSRKN